MGTEHSKHSEWTPAFESRRQTRRARTRRRGAGPRVAMDLLLLSAAVGGVGWWAFQTLRNGGGEGAKLRRAAGKGDIEAMQAVLRGAGSPAEAMQLVHSGDDGGRSALHHAAIRGRAAAANMLLIHDANIQVAAMDARRWTAAMYAARGGHAAVLRCVLQHGPQQQRLGDALVQAWEGWSAQRRKMQAQGEDGNGNSMEVKPYGQCMLQLVEKGALDELTKEVVDQFMAEVGPTLRDLGSKLPAIARQAAGMMGRAARNGLQAVLQNLQNRAHGNHHVQN